MPAQYQYPLSMSLHGGKSLFFIAEALLGSKCGKSIDIIYLSGSPDIKKKYSCKTEVKVKKQRLSKVLKRPLFIKQSSMIVLPKQRHTYYSIKLC